MKRKQAISWQMHLAALLIVGVLAACGTTPAEIKTPANAEKGSFAVETFDTEIPFASPEVIRMHEMNLGKEYVIGPGDRLRIDVWNRQKLSAEHVVGPHGGITLPLHGDFNIGGLSRSEASKAITEIYAPFYEDPIVTVTILEFLNNKVYVLGRVSNPGVIHFSGGGTLLEALSMSGGLPTRDRSIFLSKCYIIRGKDQIIWIDLLQLLQKANTKLNIRLANNDIIYIPESTDAAVFVMGEVKNPGSYQIQTSGLTLLDALNLAGGPTENANINTVRLVRGMKEKSGVKTVDLDNMIARGDFSQNYLLKDDDILYVPQKGIAKFNYYLRQIDPFLRTFITGTVVYDALGD